MKVTIKSDKIGLLDQLLVLRRADEIMRKDVDTLPMPLTHGLCYYVAVAIRELGFVGPDNVVLSHRYVPQLRFEVAKKYSRRFGISKPIMAHDRYWWPKDDFISRKAFLFMMMHEIEWTIRVDEIKQRFAGYLRSIKNYFNAE